MIKFFRRIRQKLFKEHQGSRYLLYAIGEIVLVVIGILIALQINNWNENKKARKNEIVILNQFLKNFQANDSIIKEGFTDYAAQKMYIDAMLRYSGPNPKLPEDFETADSIGRFTYVKVDLAYGSIEFPSQQIDKLTNEPLKLELSIFPSVYSSYKEQEDQLIELTLNQRRRHQKHVTLLARVSGFEKQRFESDTLGWLKDKELQNITTDKKWVTNGALRELKKLDNQNRSILNLIKLELNQAIND
ncbi:DUF6090 family protein [Croceivirga thetidis]|uniref:Uncharacterized protein n=1 Tax=Croceivirga thetidis TaxID=2721623 RepID=A0ABX1GPQ2_9FLAO|nr:DUF6090 family protein [Croceivirga thetidis]NKI30930.1 hypothetical protein [Croceivirga thetidis]